MKTVELHPEFTQKEILTLRKTPVLPSNEVSIVQRDCPLKKKAEET